MCGNTFWEGTVRHATPQSKFLQFRETISFASLKLIIVVFMKELYIHSSINLQNSPYYNKQMGTQLYIFYFQSRIGYFNRLFVYIIITENQASPVSPSAILCA